MTDVGPAAFESLEAITEFLERYYSQSTPDEPEAMDAFDPGAHTVADATVWAASATDAQLADAIATEEAGKARVTLLDAFAAEQARRVAP